MLYTSVIGNISLGSLTLGEVDTGIPIFEDNLNNWADAAAVSGQFTNPSFSDDLNNWNVLVSEGFSSLLGDITLGLFTLGEIGGAEEVQVALNEPPNTLLSVSDTNTANWSDAQLLGIGLNVPDSLNSWSDATNIGYFNFTLNQTITVGSSLATRPGPGNSPPREAWKDGFVLETNPFSGLQVNIDDLETFLSAYVLLNLGLIFSDNLTLSDSSVTSSSSTAVAFDSMFFNIGDAAAVALGSAKTESDSLNNWNDAASTLLFGAVGFGDALNLADSITLSTTSLPNPGDTLSLSDTALVVLGVRFGVSDTNSANWNDLFINGPASTVANVTVSDTLAMADGFNSSSVLLNSSLTSYLRRYLNDVIN